MDRAEVIRNLVKKGKYNSYLEIGTQKGTTFFPVKCKTKIAIDPNFHFSSKQKSQWIFKNPYNFSNDYFEQTSDEFFKSNLELLQKKGPIDIALVDGMHNFSTSLRDVLNILPHLSENGTILMHGCLPPHQAAAFPCEHYPTPEEQEMIEGWNGEWYGDVWKTLVYLRNSLRDHLEVLVLKTDNGLGIIRLKKAWNKIHEVNQQEYDKINHINYKEMIKNKESLLGLKTIDYLPQLLSEVARG